jgi:hypothetical protein
MRSLFPSSYDRADVLMSAGCSTFVSASLILVIPRFGVLLLEILLVPLYSDSDVFRQENEVSERGRG